MVEAKAEKPEVQQSETRKEFSVLSHGKLLEVNIRLELGLGLGLELGLEEGTISFAVHIVCSSAAHRDLESVPFPGSLHVSACSPMGRRKHRESLADSCTNVMVHDMSDPARSYSMWKNTTHK